MTGPSSEIDPSERWIDLGEKAVSYRWYDPRGIYWTARVAIRGTYEMVIGK